ncbi:translation initiation factor IF-2 [Tenuifilum osseticum]|uniref:translation initiation factor IF-2 n=1 Tax=Tenuifilum osseticum TaxID=3374723 RepID=UPI0034E53D13
MTSDKKIRLSKLAKEFNVGVGTLVEFLHKRGYDVENNPNAKVDQDVVTILEKEFGSELDLKKKTEQQKENLKALRDKKKTISIDDIEKDEDDFSDEPSDDEIIIKTNTIETATPTIEVEKPKIDLKVKGKIDLDTLGKKPKEPKPEPKPEEKPTPVKEQPSTPKEEKEAKPKQDEVIKPNVKVEAPKVVGKIDIEKAGKTHTKEAHRPHQKDEKPQPTKEVIKKPAVEAEKGTPAEPEVTARTQETEPEVYRAEVEKLSGPTIKGKIDLSRFEVKKKPVASSSDFDKEGKKKKRKRIKKGDKVGIDQPQEVKVDKEANKDDFKAKKLKKKNKKKIIRPEVDEEEVQRQIKETLARLTTKGKTKSSKYRREKREILSARQREELERQEQEKQVLKVSEFVSANELSAMMNVPVTDVIDVCMNLGLMVSINQRLDAETMALVADEFGYKVEFVSVDVQEVIKEEEEDKPEDLKPRPPIVTVMGHVDHGKTSLLDYIRHTNVIAGEAGGITQHIGAYSVELEDGRKITFLDTPGHEAFTAMRARGAKLTDVAIIVVAADDAVMPQTVEAINHASAAGVPIVFAINKIDKPTADPERIKGELANMNYLVEDWGGKYQCQEISAKQGLNVDKLLEKVLLEAELKDLKANPNRRASGTVIESALDKGRGYVATVLVQNGTLHQGDIMLAGIYYGHVKAMFNERGQRIQEAGPATPVQVIGLNGAPQAGDYFNILDSDREAREIANKREQLVRMQSMKTKKHITLDEIGRRIAIGNFKELNLVVKGDVDGSIEALSDSLIKLSTEQVQVNVIHKAVGQISESDILLAAASNAIVIGFQVRPSAGARKLAEKEEIDIRLYSIIYDAINEIKDAIEGMLAPEIKEEITGSAEVLETFKITKVGTVAGCIVREGKISRSNKVRLIRDGIVIYTGELESLKRFKDDVREVSSGFECGLNIKNFNDIKVGDIVEGFQEVEVKRKL